MRIAFIGARGIVGKYSGVETYCEEVGSRLVKRGHEVTAYCRSYFTPRVRTYEGMQIKRLPTIRTKHLETFVHSCLCVVDAMFRNYDIVQLHALGSSPLAVIPRLRGLKTVVAVHGLDGQRAKWNVVAKHYLEACEWTSAYCPSATIVVSRCLADYYARRFQLDTTCIPNGVSVKTPIPPKQITTFGLGHKDYILFVGRLTPEKGCLELINAYKGMETSLKLVFVGGGTYADAYVNTLKRHASDRILFLGYQSGEILEELFSNAYLYVLPSTIEGLSLSLLEAMAYGNCVLASDIPENLELVSRHGFSFHSGDIEHLRYMMTHLIKHPQLAESTGKANRNYIQEHYTWEMVTDQTEKTFTDLLNGSQKR
jgi:glycosyltransferase involved in cell wall biosynthesis